MLLLRCLKPSRVRPSLCFVGDALKHCHQALYEFLLDLKNIRNSAATAAAAAAAPTAPRQEGELQSQGHRALEGSQSAAVAEEVAAIAQEEKEGEELAAAVAGGGAITAGSQGRAAQDAPPAAVNVTRERKEGEALREAAVAQENALAIDLDEESDLTDLASLWSGLLESRKTPNTVSVPRRCASVPQGKMLFCVKWKGYSSEENTWEPREFLTRS